MSALSLMFGFGPRGLDVSEYFSGNLVLLPWGDCAHRNVGKK